MKARGSASQSLSQHPCSCRAVPFLQTGSQPRNTCSLPGSKCILQSLSRCIFISLCLPAQKVGCASLPLPAAVWLKRLCSPRALVSAAPPASPQQASPVVPGERAAFLVPKRHPLTGECRCRGRLSICSSAAARQRNIGWKL